MTKRKRESLREEYKPNKVKVLFIGESPPDGCVFFYKANSNLFRYTKEAFSEAFNENWKNGQDFLGDFQKKYKCYLDDLCHEPINHLDRQPRLERRRQAEPDLAKRIKEYKPEVIIVVMIAIKGNVERAIERANLEISEKHFLPFPAQGHQKRYVKELVTILRRWKLKSAKKR